MTPSGTPPAAGAAVAMRRRGPRWAVFAGVAGLVVLLDQLSKAWVDASFALPGPGPSAGPTPVVGDVVRIAKVYNDGGIFGLLGDSAPILGLASLLVIGGIVWYHRRHGATGGLLVSVGLGLLLGGAIGNLIDRVRVGYVIDWVDTGIGSLRWYTFNVADAAIFSGLVLLVGVGLLGDRLPVGRRQSGGGQAAEHGAPPAGAP